MKIKPILLMILDGFGLSNIENGNAIKVANTKAIDNLFQLYPNTRLKASGLSVGLPDGQMGNSEVGHLNIGSGRVVYQSLTKINKSIIEGDFFNNTQFISAIDHCKEHKTKLHLCGLLSDGGVHSSMEHLYALIKLAKGQGLDEVYIHAFLDGRDTPVNVGVEYISKLEEKISQIGIGKIATISGRYYAMDRDNRWDRVKLAYDAMVYGIGSRKIDPKEVARESYLNAITDEFVVPTVITQNMVPIAVIEDNDAVIHFNFRPDRARQLSRALTDKEFVEFERKTIKPYYVCMTEYDKSLKDVNVAFMPELFQNTLGEYLSKNHYRQLRIAETEKYAHVTFFFNGGTESISVGEERVLVDSPKVTTYDLKPEMSAYEVTNRLIQEIDRNVHDVIILNYANCDMVGHTGDFDAVVKAIETIDKCVGVVVEKIKEKNGVILLTADHGNAENMIGEERTTHTLNDVPLIVIGAGEIKLKTGKLCDIAPTILEIMDIEKPEQMSGHSLII